MSDPQGAWNHAYGRAGVLVERLEGWEPPQRHVRRRGVSNPVRRALEQIELTQRDMERHAAMTDDDLRQDLRDAEAMMRGAFGPRAGGYYGDPSPESWRAGKLAFAESKIRDLKRFAEGEVGMEPITDVTVWQPDRMLERISGAEQRGLIRFAKDLSPAQRQMLAEVAVELRLDPLFREITIYEGQLYIEIDGWYRKVRESGIYDGEETFAPTTDDLRMIEAQTGDMVVGVRVHIKGQRVPSTAFGVVRAAERQERRTRDGRSFDPTTKTYAFRMAEKRAQIQAYRKAGFKVRGMTPALIDELPPEAWDAEGEVVGPDPSEARCATCNLPIVPPEGWTVGALNHPDCAPRARPSEEVPAQATTEPLAEAPGPVAATDDDHEGRLLYYAERTKACLTQDELLEAKREIEADPNLSTAEKAERRRRIGARSGELSKHNARPALEEVPT